MRNKYDTEGYEVADHIDNYPCYNESDDGPIEKHYAILALKQYMELEQKLFGDVEE